MEENITNAEYIKKKKEFVMNFLAAENEEVKTDTWNRIRSQINSGLYLGLSHQEIDMYATPEYDYSQQEIIKYAIYAGLDVHKLKGMPAESMTVAIAGMYREDGMLGKLSGPLGEISAAIGGYREELDALKHMYKASEEVYKERTESLQAEKKRLKDRIKNADEEIKKLTDLIKKKDEEIKKLTVDAEKAARERAEKAAPETQHQAAPEKAHRETIHPARKARARETGRHKRKSGTAMTDETVLPEDFDLTAYIINKAPALDETQLKLITYAAGAGMPDIRIKEITDMDIPAAQMKQVMELYFVKKRLADERRRKNEQNRHETDNTGNTKE